MTTSELLPDLALFVAVAEAGSFTGASRALRVPVSTLSRRIAALEAQLGLQLLLRSTRAVRLSRVGNAWFARYRDILAEAERAQSELLEGDEAARGHLRVSATPDFSLTFLTPLFADFARRYPEVSFEFDLTPRSVDLLAEGFDVAIRMGQLTDSQLTGRRLGWARCALYASPAYLASAPPLRKPQDLVQHSCIRLLRPAGPVRSWRLSRGGRDVEVAVHGRFVSNNFSLQSRLCALGLGVAVLDVKMSAPEVEAGRLTRVLPGWTPPRVAVHALTPSRLVPARTRLFLACLTEHLQL